MTPEARLSERPLRYLAVTLMLNTVLLSVSILWLAGQFTVILAWGSLSRGEVHVMIDREGWLIQTLPNAPLHMLRGSRFGVDTQNMKGLENGRWSQRLDDSHFRQPVPGIVRAHGVSFDITGFRHWFGFGIALTTWSLWQLHQWRQSTGGWTGKGPKSRHSIRPENAISTGAKHQSPHNTLAIVADWVYSQEVKNCTGAFLCKPS